jgi:hypothetical protein
MGPSGDEEQKPLVVNWDSSNQGALQMAFEWGQSPSTLEILYAQEDLWLLHALMTIIKQTNGDADAQYNAAIKEIETIEFGANAAGIKVVGQVSSPGAGTASGGYGSGYDTGSGSGFGSGSPSMETSAGGSGSGAAELDPYASGGFGGVEQVAPDPADKRYVDTKNEPLEATRLRTAMQSATKSDAFLVVAKRMPVRMRFKMDLMKLPLLMVNCANSALPFEIRQVRINAPAAPSGGMGGGYGSGGMMGSGPSAGPMGAGSGAGMGMGAPAGGGDEYGGGGDEYDSGDSGGYGSGSGSGFGSGSGGYGSGGPMQAPDSPYDGTVELYGIVYIYNPVDANKLGLEETAAATDPSASPAAVPAAGIPAADTPAADTATDPTADSGTTPAAGPGDTTETGGDGTAAAAG